MAIASAKQFAEWEDVNNVTVVRLLLHRVVDLNDITGLFDQVNRLVDPGGSRQLLMSFRGVNSFGSYAIGGLLALDKKVNALSGRLALCELTPVLAEILDIMRLRRHFHVYPTEQEALESF